MLWLFWCRFRKPHWPSAECNCERDRGSSYLDRTVEVLDGKIPDPSGTVTKDNDSAGTVQSAADCLCVNALAKVIRSLNRAYIGRGFFIAERSCLCCRRLFE